jgi:hypothetical protein
MNAAPGIVTSGVGPPNAAVEVQPGMLVQPVVLVDEYGQYVTTSGSLATAGYLATQTTSVYVAGGSAPTTGQELIATSGTTATWQFGASGVLTTLGDMLFENSTPALARLAGNTSTTKMFLTQTGNGTVSANPAWGTIATSDLPAATTAVQGAVILSGSASTIQPAGTAASAGAIVTTKAAYADHIHPPGSSFLCAPTVYAPASQTSLTVIGQVMAPFVSEATTVAAGSNGGEISTIASWSSPSAGVLDVASTAGFPSSGTLFVAASGTTVAIVTYTGTAGGNQFTGCAYVSGSASGTVATGGAVGLAAGAASLVNTGSFTAPASGEVMVTVTFVGLGASSANIVGLGLAATGTVTPMVTNVETTTADGGAAQIPWTIRFLVTGLNPGTSYDFDLVGCVTAGGSFKVVAQGQTSTALSSGSTGGPAIMTVQAI